MPQRKSVAEKRQAQYRNLKELDADLYRQCVQSADGIMMNHAYRIGMTEQQRLALAADIEAVLVAFALYASSRAARGAR